jgi:hypothetical protein
MRSFTNRCLRNALPLLLGVKWILVVHREPLLVGCAPISPPTGTFRRQCATIELWIARWLGKLYLPDSTASESLCPRRASMSTSTSVPLAALGLIRSPAKLAACVG